ncbi:Homeodomain-interacting protein kinase 2 [Takifugu flavidus]|uniref:Homeodomain-interacting protein kinase 2 n=2 Tax=Takifugu flavidus TaxID=433684 RepID=A0A5C6MLQ8_9TELE|nr:Homeodomain-interacting protein kinase 2 [Takifugu flavidus]
METAVVTPPTAALPKPLMQDSIEKIVQGILEKQQQQHRPEQKRRQTKTSLACGQPKSRYGTDGSSIHFFYQQGPVRYFYCSRKEPSDEAKRVSSTPQDKSVATREDLVRQNALAVIPQRGGGGVPQIRWRFWETQYLLKRQQPTTSSTPAEHPMKAPAEPLENVMIVDHHEKPLQVKLVDFGGAQMSGNIDFETLMFTKMYSSPEVLLESEMNEALDMWSLGVTAFKLAVGTDLFPYSRRYSIINSVVKILGQPPDHVLDKGQQTEEFFNRRTNDHPRWTIKTAEEYGISEKEEDFSCFDDVVGMLSVQQEHATGLDLFMDLIKNMLQVDPNQRITPVEALQHPFFNVKEEAASKKPCLENIKLTNYAVDQLEKPELVPPETVVSQENPAEVQPDNSGEDQLNDGFQTGDNTLNYTCFVNTLRTVGHALALPKRTEKFDWFGWF